MTTTQQAAVDQRLDQHADAFEIVLARLDDLTIDIRRLTRRLPAIEARLRELESIVLPHSDRHR